MNGLVDILYLLRDKDLSFQRKIEQKVKIWAGERNVKARMSGKVELTREQKNEVDQLWGRYKKISYYSHAFYLEKTGTFNPYYVPNYINRAIIDPFFNDWSMARYLDNKCYYPRMFPGVRMPEIVAMRVNGFWCDAESNLLGEQEAKNMIMDAGCCFIKAATEAFGGKGVYYFDPQDMGMTGLENLLTKLCSDIVIQKEIKQSQIISKLNASSLNTLRLTSLLRKDGTVKIYGAMLRMGSAGAKVDNGGSGGIMAQVSDDGRLAKIAYNEEGITFEKHPTSQVRFEDIIIPNYQEAREIIYKLHPMVPHFRLVAWDIGFAQDDRPFLLEANLNGGGINGMQLTNGPLFKEDTEEILDEVFGK